MNPGKACLRLGRGRRKGFTLIEVICVVATMGVILSIAYPSLSGFMMTRS